MPPLHLFSSSARSPLGSRGRGDGSTEGCGGWAQLRNSKGPLRGWESGVPPEQPGQAWLEERREGGNRSTDRLMAPAVHTIEFALLSLPALGKASPGSSAGPPEPQGLPGSARPDSVRSSEGHRGHKLPSAQRGRWLSPER